MPLAERQAAGEFHGSTADRIGQPVKWHLTGFSSLGGLDHLELNGLAGTGAA